MFFWNKFCGFTLIFFILPISLYAQNSVGSLLPENRVLFKNKFSVAKHTEYIFGNYQPPVLYSSKVGAVHSYLFLSQSHNALPKKGFSLPSASPSSEESTSVNGLALTRQQPMKESVLSDPFYFLSKIKNSQVIPANFSICNYGFFCKQELKMEEATKLLIRIRLGSLQQCNYYEGKQ